MATHVCMYVCFNLRTFNWTNTSKKESFIVQRTHRHRLHKNIYNVAWRKLWEMHLTEPLTASAAARVNAK